jgi:hypothetical protein
MVEKVGRGSPTGHGALNLVQVALHRYNASCVCVCVSDGGGLV